MDDLIKRADAIEAVEEWLYEVFGTTDYRQVGVFATLSALPSVDRPHGEWIVDTYNMELRCGICGETFRFDDVDEVLDYREYAKYCLACGALMGGDGE